MARICHHRARSKSTTWTGLLLACFFRALAESYSSSADYCVAASVLVDLRSRMLPEDDDNRKLMQIQSTVTIGRYIEVSEIRRQTDEQNIVAWLWKAAQEIGIDLRQRIDRGEAHRSALAMATGKGLEEICSATIEFSNHGVYEGATDVEVSQRYDGYEGLSIIAHSNNGALKITGSLGSDLDHSKVNHFFEKVKSFIHMVGSA